MAASIACASSLAAHPLEWPRWELGGQLNLLAAAETIAVRFQGIAGRFLGRHELELHGAASQILEATALDLDGGYALHARWRLLLPFLRVAAGARFEHVGGGLSRARAAFVGGAGVKLLFHRVVGARLDLEYRYLTGAPAVTGELGLLLGITVLW